jgi:phage-related protein
MVHEPYKGQHGGLEGCIVVLHGFIKKSRKTPNDELALARRRKKEFEP